MMKILSLILYLPLFSVISVYNQASHQTYHPHSKVENNTKNKPHRKTIERSVERETERARGGRVDDERGKLGIHKVDICSLSQSVTQVQKAEAE